MKYFDIIELGLENLWRTKLRSTLTTLGVVIGIGALTSMISFGTGMQKNVTDAFKESDLFTSLFITSKNINMDKIATGNPEEMTQKSSSSLTDSTLETIRQLPGVSIAFPEIRFPVKIRVGHHETNTTLQALPVSMGQYKPFNELMAGSFFTDDSSSAAILDWHTLKRMKLVIRDPENPKEIFDDDSLEIMDADSMMDKTVDIHSTAFAGFQLPFNPMSALFSTRASFLKESVTTFEICGIIKKPQPFSSDRFRAGIIIPMKSARKIPRLGFTSVWELLDSQKKHDVYNAFYVRVHRMNDMRPVRTEIEKMGLHVYSISDELQEIKRSFLIMDSILGAVGTIALIVAALGIINTMVMSILERTREIGIMKSIGASENEIKLIFFTEAAVIGSIGAILGLMLGWIVTRIANIVANAQLLPAGESPVDLFYFPLWLILGAIAFSVCISLIAGLYPAIRAARVDPIQALRHD